MPQLILEPGSFRIPFPTATRISGNVNSIYPSTHFPFVHILYPILQAIRMSLALSCQSANRHGERGYPEDRTLMTSLDQSPPRPHTQPQ